MKPESLIAAGIIGSDKISELPPAPHPCLVSCWQEIQLQPTPSNLLAAAALEASLVKSGVLPVSDLPEEPACPEEVRPWIPAELSPSLSRLLDGDFAMLLPEWLQLAIESQVIISPRFIPRLLDLADRDRALRPHVSTASGQRGTWLAQHLKRSDWLWRAEQDKTNRNSVWQEGNLQERIDWLRDLHSENPSEASKLISIAWSNESPDFRESIAKISATSPKEEDHIWLESFALKERRRTTYEYAITALMQIPSSNFAKRQVARAESVLMLQKKLTGSLITLSLPEQFSSELAADGIQEKNPTGISPREWWALQIVARVPLTHWLKIFDWSPKQFNNIKLHPDYADSIANAWAESAARFPPNECSFELLGRLLQAQPATTSRNESITRIFSALPPKDLPIWLETKSLQADLAVKLILDSEATLHHQHQPKLYETLTQSLYNEKIYMDRRQAASLAGRIHPESINLTLQNISKLNKVTNATEHFASALEFRVSYLNQFSNIHQS